MFTPRAPSPAVAWAGCGDGELCGVRRLKNGELLDLAERAGFDVLVTGDKSLEFEQSMTGRKIAVVALSANAWRIIKPNAGRIAAAVDAAQPGTVTHVDCGQLVRPRRLPPEPAP